MKYQPQRLYTPVTHRIFIAVSQADVFPHLQQVCDTLGRLDQLPILPEPLETPLSDAAALALEKLASSQLFLGIISWNYGPIPPDEVRSVPHLQYQEAKRLGLPRLLFLAADETGPDDRSATLSPESAKIYSFREEIIRDGVAGYFTTAGDLATVVATALSAYLLKQQEEEARKRPQPPHHLPLEPGGFVGREQELARLADLLHPGQQIAPAVALVGMGGVGKSALATLALHHLAYDESAFPGGVTWVRCDERQGFAGLIWIYDRLLADWNITLAPAERASATTLEGALALRERVLRARLHPPGSPEPLPQALVLLDNVERDLPVHHALETLGALNIAVLLTTRVEQASPRLHLVPLEVLEPLAALHLFARAYSDAGGDWEPDRDSPSAASIVAALGHLPLALVLSAARAARNRLSVQALAQEFTQPDLLARLKDPLRQNESVRYSFERSLALLHPAQRGRFVTLGLPDGPDWPRPIIERLFEVVPPDAPEMNQPADDLDLLTALSLVTLQAPDPSTPDRGNLAAPRVRLHPLLRELAREEWEQQSPERHRLALEALLAYISALIQQDPHDYSTLEREESLIAGTIRRAASQHINLPTLDTAIQVLFDYIEFGGHWRLGMKLYTLQRNLRHDLGNRSGEGATLIKLGGLASSLGRSEQALQTFGLAIEVLKDEADLALQANAIATLGSLNGGLGRKEAARHYTEQAVTAFHRVGNRLGESLAHNDLALLAFSLGQQDEAFQHARQAQEVTRQIVDLRERGAALHHLGNVAKLMGQIEEAQRSYQQALMVQREMGDRQGEGATLNDLGQVLQMQGRQDEAASVYRDALAAAREAGDRRNEGDALNNLGTLARKQERYDEATGYYQLALKAARDLGDRQRELDVLRQQAQLAQATGNAAEAIRSCEQALNITKEMGQQPQEAVTLTLLGSLSLESGHYEQSFAYFEQSLALERQLGQQAGIMTALMSLGAVTQLLEQHAEAIRFFQEALPLAASAHDLTSSVTCLMGLGVEAMNLGQTAEARNWLEQALPLQQQMGNQEGAALTLGLLAQLAEQQVQPEQAISFYQQQLELLQALHDQAGAIQALLALGNLAQSLKRTEEALASFEQATNLLLAAGDHEHAAVTLTRMGALLKGLERWDEAIALLKQALAMEQTEGRKRNAGIILFQLGGTAAEQGRPDEAARFYQQALALFQELDDQPLVARVQEKLTALAPASQTPPTPDSAGN